MYYYFRLRMSMEGFLDAFDPNKSVTPAGIFTNRVEVRVFYSSSLIMSAFWQRSIFHMEELTSQNIDKIVGIL